MNYITVDFEWNQAYAVKTQKRKDFVIQLDGEIIQIGAVKLNQSFDIVDTFIIIVDIKQLMIDF